MSLSARCEQGRLLTAVGMAARHESDTARRTNLTIRLLGSDDFPPEAKHAAASDLTTAAREGALSIPAIELLALDAIARAHDMVDAGSGSRVLLTLGTAGGPWRHCHWLHRQTPRVALGARAHYRRRPSFHVARSRRCHSRRTASMSVPWITEVSSRFSRSNVR